MHSLTVMKRDDKYTSEEILEEYIYAKIKKPEKINVFGIFGITT